MSLRPLNTEEVLWIAALDRVAIAERIEWVQAMLESVRQINAKRVADDSPHDPWDWELEAREQMAAKLEAQNALRLICAALDLELASLGNGWSEAVPKILERVETILDEAERAFTERNTWKARYERLAESEAARRA